MLPNLPLAFKGIASCPKPMVVGNKRLLKSGGYKPTKDFFLVLSTSQKPPGFLHSHALHLGGEDFLGTSRRRDPQTPPIGRGAHSLEVIGLLLALKAASGGGGGRRRCFFGGVGRPRSPVKGRVLGFGLHVLFYPFVFGRDRGG